VHPLALRTLDELGIDIRGQRSKHLDEYQGQPFDYIITVCDQVREICPAFPHRPEQIHWSIADPAAVPDTDQPRAFEGAARELATRIRYLSLLNRWGAAAP
jgi:protein-tyrosine-phosphatase